MSLNGDASSILSNPRPTTGEHPGGPRHTEDPFRTVAATVRNHLAIDSSGHDIHHAWRVFRLTQRLSDELGVDREVVGCAALVHDLHRVMDDGSGCAPAETLLQIEEILAEAGLDEGKIEDIKHCVDVHDEYAFQGDDIEQLSTEAQILRDADNLDAIGAVGIARTFAYGGVHGTPLWDPEGEEYSQLYHFEDKLLRLREEFHTRLAQEIAEERLTFLHEFFDRFVAEWHGKK